jgi:hypothetical protein
MNGERRPSDGKLDNVTGNEAQLANALAAIVEQNLDKAALALRSLGHWRRSLHLTQRLEGLGLLAIHDP